MEEDGSVNLVNINMDETETKMQLVGTDSDGQHYIVVTGQESEAIDLDIATEEDQACCPTNKRIRLESADGQTYLLAVSEGDERATFIKVQDIKDDPTELVSSEPAVGDQEDLTTIIEACEGSTSSYISSDHQSCCKKSGMKMDVSQAWFTTRDDKTTLHKTGHHWKQGQWSKSEIQILQSNISEYCKELHVTDPTEIIFEMSKDERKNFYRIVARGLDRPLFSVYRRIIRMYDQKNHIGKYSLEEMAKLRELRAKHANDWSAIGAELGRSASSIKDKCRLMKDTCNTGKWLPEEEKRLTAAVYTLAGVHPGESVTRGLSWAAVAENVKTRSEKQCRTKWLNILNWKQKGGTEWSRDDDINLIIKLGNMEAEEECDIDWNALTIDWASVRSPQWLRSKWWSLKRRITDYQMLSFAEIVECLKTVHLDAVRFKGTHGSIGIKVAHIDYQHDLSVADSSEGNLQTYEVYPHLTPTTSSAYLITQPQNNPAISMSGAAMITSDHIIVHTLPVSHISDLKGNENVTVQMNPHIIVTNPNAVATSLGTTDISETIQLGSSIDQSETDLQADLISPEGTEETFPTQMTSDELDVDDGGSTDDTKLEVVLVNASVAGYSRSGNNESELLSSMSDPMLNTESMDLIGSASDMEGDKTPGSELSADINETET